jgi:hypothetical protein
MLIKKEKKDGITIYHVDKNIPDDKMDKLKNTFVNPSQIQLIIEHDADVYDANGDLLLKFRKNKLTQSNIDAFYDNVIDFAKTPSTNRGSTSGSKLKNIADNPKIMTNILGYMDTFSPKQKFMMKTQGKHIKLRVRETRFNMDYPTEFNKAKSLIQEIDKYYKQYAPEYYKKQKHKADQTNFKIDDTSFTTITTNLNFRTSIHKDKGDDAEGFGNLTVIQRGNYTGGETCFPQYGVGVDVREGDVLFMNVHKWHGNLPMKFENKDALRLSIVCYLRVNVWKNTIGISKQAMIKHNQAVKNLRGHTFNGGNKKTRKIRPKK